MRTYKATFKVTTPIITNYHGIMFDALIMKQWLQISEIDKGIGRRYIPDSELINLADLDLFAYHTDGWAYASRLLCGESFWDSMFWCKRFSTNNAIEFSDVKGVINKQAGRYKSYKGKLSTLNVKEAWFYFAVDNDNQLEKIKSCLNEITSLGKKSMIGYGDCSLSDLSLANNDVWQTIIRAIPMRMIKDKAGVSNVAYMNWYPPYWQDNRELCAIAGTL